MLHNASARARSQGKQVTRTGSFKLTLAVAALAAMPAIVLAGPIPGLPPLPGQPQPQPQPAPQPQPQPAPGSDDSTYENQGQQPQVTSTGNSETQPYAYSGPVRRVRLGGVWGYK